MPTAEYYQEHRDRYIEQANRRADNARQIIREYKEQPCADCGQTFPYFVMDLDHCNGTKFRSPGQMLTYSEAKLRVELEKCEVRCSNCHRLRHRGDGPGKARSF